MQVGSAEVVEKVSLSVVVGVSVNFLMQVGSAKVLQVVCRSFAVNFMLS